MKPTIGRVVHYVYAGDHKAAIVLRVWSDTCVNLVVFSDTAPDAVAEMKTSVKFDPTGKADRSWHWPEREGE